MLSIIYYLVLCFSHVLAQEVALESSLPFEGAQACPGKDVSFTCEVTGGTLLTWIVPPFITEGSSDEASFLKSDEPGNSLTRPSEARRFFLSTSPFRSTLVLQSTENVTNTTVVCITNNNVRGSLLYRKAEIPLPPSNITVNTPQISSNGSFIIEAQWKAPDGDIFYDYQIYVFVVNRPELYNGEKLINNATSDLVTFNVSDFTSSSTFELRIDIFTVNNCDQPSHTNESKTFEVRVPRGSSSNIAAIVTPIIVIAVIITIVLVVVVIVCKLRDKRKQYKLEEQEVRINELEEKVEVDYEVIIKLDKENQWKQEHIHSLKKKTNDLNEELDEKQQQIDSLIEMKEDLQKELDEKQKSKEDLKVFEEKLQKAVKQIEELEQEKKAIKQLYKLTNFVLSTELERNNVQNMNENSGEPQQPPDSNLAQFILLQADYKELKGKLESVTEQRDSSETQVKNLETKVKKLEAAEVELREKLESVTEQRDNFETQVKNLETKVKKLEAAKVEMREELKSVTEQRDNSETQENQETKVKQLEDEVEELKTRLELRNKLAEVITSSKPGTPRHEHVSQSDKYHALMHDDQKLDKHDTV